MKPARLSPFLVFVFLPVLPALCLAFEFPFTEATEVTTLDSLDKQHSAQVNASDKFWRSAGIRLEAGHSYLISAEGTWQVGGLCNPTGPDGISPYTLACWDLGPATRTVGPATHSSLIGKIGHGGEPFAVGNAREITPLEPGILYLMVNDHPDFFWDNSGHVTAKVRVLKFAAPEQQQPPAQATPGDPASMPPGAPPADPTIKRGGGGGGGRSDN